MPNTALASAMSRDAKKPSQDKLDKIRALVREARDLDKEIDGLEEMLKEKKAELLALTQKKLPDAFVENGVSRLDLAAEGNMPAYDAELRPYYHANILADWPPDQREAGFGWLESKKHGDLIKNVVTVEIPRGKGAAALSKKVTGALKKLRVPYGVEKAVPWNTLTALVRELTESGKPLGDKDREAIGATVGTVVKLKQRKEEK